MTGYELPCKYCDYVAADTADYWRHTMQKHPQDPGPGVLRDDAEPTVGVLGESYEQAVRFAEDSRRELEERRERRLLGALGWALLLAGLLLPVALGATGREATVAYLCGVLTVSGLLLAGRG
jgi:hypothetical protein